MAKLPVMSGRDAVKIFESLVWAFARQNSSHIVLTKAGETASLCIPDHQEVRKGTLRGLIRSANLTIDEFLAAT